MYYKPNAPKLTPELAKQMLHTANFYINLKREAIERHGAHKLEVAALNRYEAERDMLETWLEENQA